jgi:DivIVA domain-containing protein
MRLTPADVHNVAFKKPSIGKRGYDEDEVDAFLDIVEAELTRLIEENNELSQRLAAYESGAAPTNGYQGYSETAQPAAPEAPDNTAEIQAYIDAAPEDQVHDHEAPGQAGEQATEQAEEPVQPQAAQEAAPVAEAAAAPVVAAPVVAGIADHHLHAARLLGLAEETAARVTAEADAEAENTRSAARAESEKLLTDSRNESEKLLTDSRNESERMLSEAKNDSEKMVADATAKAESTVRDSEIKAEALDREAQRKYSEVMTQLTTQRTALENKIDGLRTYEREYRSRLKNWINDQLHQLDVSDGDADSDQPVSVGQGPGQQGSPENNGAGEANG